MPSTLIRTDATRRLPVGLKVPKPVKQANLAATEAAEVLDRAHAETERLVRELNAAPAADDLAIRRALDSGEDPPPRTAPRLEAKLEDARAVEHGAKVRAVNATNALYAEVDRHYDELIAGVEAEVEAQAVAAVEQIDELLERLAEFTRRNECYQQLRQFQNPVVSPLSSESDAGYVVRKHYAKQSRTRRSVVAYRGLSMPIAAGSLGTPFAATLAALRVELEARLAGGPGSFRHDRPTLAEADGEVIAEAVREQQAAVGYKRPRPVPSHNRRDRRGVAA